MMVVEETTGSVFPSDLYLQPGVQPTVTSENLADEMLRGERSGFFGRSIPAEPGPIA